MLTIGGQPLNDLYVGSQQISEVYVGQTKIYPENLDPTEPFYIENTGNAASIAHFTPHYQTALTGDVYYSDDKTIPLANWNHATFTVPASGTATNADITIPAHSKMYFHMDATTITGNRALGKNTGVDYLRILGGGNRIGGNIMSLLYGSSFTGQETAFDNYAFERLFYLSPSEGFGTIRDAGKLILPSTTSTLCYLNMFIGQTLLTQAPKLPALTLSNGCYQAMFEGCTGLIVPPTLPATTTAQSCYYRMFKDCTALKDAPTLMATDLRDNCYEQMFQGCSLLGNITCNAVNFGTNSVNLWVKDVSAVGTFYKNSTSTWGNGASGIPDNWTVNNI